LFVLDLFKFFIHLIHGVSGKSFLPRREHDGVLDRGMVLTGTKVVEEPTNNITQDAVVTGTAPK